ncbi:hypothetical protein [Rhizobium bangladeshense]|uniref:hypothetical protein n=1 Tax=Rhizobium bangladeshense TaxID=1138189 RepID=UPI001C834968|nr:hypothetical protein [Rhizobium bangladeshense]
MEFATGDDGPVGLRQIAARKTKKTAVGPEIALRRRRAAIGDVGGRRDGDNRIAEVRARDEAGLDPAAGAKRHVV